MHSKVALVNISSDQWPVNNVKDTLPLSFCHQRMRACAPWVPKGTLVVSSLESQKKRAGWWRA